MTGIEKLFGSQRAITILVISVVFAIVFPAYFSFMASNSDDLGGASSGAKGKWQVDFIQDNITSDETMNLGDGEQGDYFFELDSGDMMIGFVEITVSCNDNDDTGPGTNDDVDVSTDFSGVEGTPDDESGSGSCNGDTVSFTIGITPEWDGSSYIADGVSKNDIEAQWTDGGNGTGEWLTSVVMNVNTELIPVNHPFADEDEDVTVSWRVAVYSLEITAVAEEL
ncbi:MAG: hypothetical protein CXT67_01970 [Methanobacteriota archaeon]|nr:MAG: hypothetical protein CXT67_01970 [Euryarchaeota archaeon]HIG20789.1 hypothetical protein [Candidatus Poseidoniales archaeon]